MKKTNQGFTAAELLLVCYAALIILVIGCWGVNIYKLTQCDFEAPYKGEIIHAVGIVPIAAPFTVWNDDK